MTKSKMIATKLKFQKSVKFTTNKTVSTALGIVITIYPDRVSLEPLDSNLDIAACAVEIPIKDIDMFINTLQINTEK